MANVNAPSGLKAKYHRAGGVMRLSEYTIASGLAANIYAGDLVKSTGTGRNITVCAAGERGVGVFDGVKYVDAAGNVQFSRRWATGTTLATGTTATALVYDDQGIVFEVQASAAFVEADVNLMSDITAATAGNATTGQSGMQWDSAFPPATASAQLKAIGLSPDPNNAYGTNAKILVIINEHENGAAVTGL